MGLNTDERITLGFFIVVEKDNLQNFYSSTTTFIYRNIVENDLFSHLVTFNNPRLSNNLLAFKQLVARVRGQIIVSQVFM